MTGCRTNYKRFATEQDAQDSLKRIRKVARERHPVRWYPCNYCGGFHLTASPGYIKISPLKLIYEQQFKQYLKTN